jgi:hypothetical protein
MHILNLLIALSVVIPVSLFIVLLITNIVRTINENHLIKNDIVLRKLKWEIENDDNDGWSKIHYKTLYEKRKKELKGGRGEQTRRLG